MHPPANEGPEEFRLTPEVADDTGRRTQAMMAWYCRKNPEIADVLTEKKRRAFAGVFKQMVTDYDRDTIRAICVGIYFQYPYSPPPDGRSAAFTPHDMARIAEKCIIDGRRELARRERIRRRVEAAKKYEPDRTTPPPMRSPNDEAGAEFLRELEEKQRRRERVARRETPRPPGAGNNIGKAVDDALRQTRRDGDG